LLFAGTMGATRAEKVDETSRVQVNAEYATAEADNRATWEPQIAEKLRIQAQALGDGADEATKVYNQQQVDTLVSAKEAELQAATDHRDATLANLDATKASDAAKWKYLAMGALAIEAVLSFWLKGALLVIRRFFALRAEQQAISQVRWAQQAHAKVGPRMIRKAIRRLQWAGLDAADIMQAFLRQNGMAGDPAAGGGGALPAGGGGQNVIVEPPVDGPQPFVNLPPVVSPPQTISDPPVPETPVHATTAGFGEA
jgi:hypothetical protein